MLKPTTFMNNSGVALKEIKNFYNIDIKNIYVIHDEIDLDQGRVKVKNGGGHNGHNGLKSIDKLIGQNYNRIRVGVSRPTKIYNELRNIFIYLFENSGFKDVKISESVDFEKLYQTRKTQ